MQQRMHEEVPATAVGGTLKLKDELPCAFDIVAQTVQT